MNALVLYDSKYGNTEQVAQAIMKSLSAHGMVRAERVDIIQPSDVHGVSLLVLGCPTQRHRPSPAMQDFLKNVPPQVLQGVAVACFDTRIDTSDWLMGSAARGIAKQLKKTGISLLVPPESFIVEDWAGPLRDGELERAVIWGHMLHAQLETARLVDSSSVK